MFPAAFKTVLLQVLLEHQPSSSSPSAASSSSRSPSPPSLSVSKERRSGYVSDEDEVVDVEPVDDEDE